MGAPWWIMHVAWSVYLAGLMIMLNDRLLILALTGELKWH